MFSLKLFLSRTCYTKIYIPILFSQSSQMIVYDPSWENIESSLCTLSAIVKSSGKVKNEWSLEHEYKVC